MSFNVPEIFSNDGNIDVQAEHVADVRMRGWKQLFSGVEDKILNYMRHL